MAPGSLTPLAILVSGVLIAAALYFRPGNADGGAAPSAAPEVAAGAGEEGRDAAAASKTPTSGEAPTVASVIDKSARDPAAQEAAREQASDEVAAQLEAAKGRLAAACWAPALLRAPEPATFVVNVQIGFNRAGDQVGWALQEIRGKSRPDVAQCLRGQNPRLKIGPLGEFFRWTGALHFP